MVWLLASIGIFYLTDFAAVVLYDTRVDRRWLYGALSLFLIAGICCSYCIIWLSWIKKIHSDYWEDSNQFVIPVATASMLLGTIALCKSLWSVWSFLTVLIVGTQVMGLVVFVAMIPSIN